MEEIQTGVTDSRRRVKGRNVEECADEKRAERDGKRREGKGR